VYEAYDQELGVTVALKVIRPDAIADRDAASEVERRFKRELLLARKVTHKNVVRIYDLGEIDGIKYITMSYVEGSDLATVIDRAGGKLTVACALRVARQIVSGLVAAHEAGVVHRDLKPANIMIDAKTDNALIMDFGIARAAGAAPPLRTEVAAPSAEPSDSDDARWAAPIPTTALAATRAERSLTAFIRLGSGLQTTERRAIPRLATEPGATATTREEGDT
jgi:serine/threonine protein kinase